MSSSVLWGLSKTGIHDESNNFADRQNSKCGRNERRREYAAAAAAATASISTSTSSLCQQQRQQPQKPPSEKDLFPCCRLLRPPRGGCGFLYPFQGCSLNSTAAAAADGALVAAAAQESL